MGFSGTIAVAGASGFVGTRLMPELVRRFPEATAIALSRTSTSEGEWLSRSCDLFSLNQTLEALEGVDIAVYMVHSMLRKSALSQGEFQDFDFLVADNFARSCEVNGVKHVIYLSGIIPKEESLSHHLSSRLEVEQTLSARGTPVTSLRAGMVIGPQGSSFTMVEKLVDRLPVMICPKWTASECQPVDIRDVVESICYFIDKEPKTQVFDIGCEQKITYLNLMNLVAGLKGKKRFFLSVPAFSPKLSVLWVSLVTGAPGPLVKPLIQSLRHRMVLDPNQTLVIENHPFHSLEDSISFAMKKESQTKIKAPHAFRKTANQKVVRSVQRLRLPSGRDAQWVAQQYMDWLPKFFRVIQVCKEGQRICFRFLGASLLTLTHVAGKSSSERQLFLVSSGLLVTPNPRARFEFRETADGKSVVAAVHDFTPSLPWYIYRNTQAKLHLWVMKRFGAYLRRLS